MKKIEIERTRLSITVPTAIIENIREAAREGRRPFNTQLTMALEQWAEKNKEVKNG